MKHQKRLTLIFSSILFLGVALLWWKPGLWDNSTAGDSEAPSVSAPKEREFAKNRNKPSASDSLDKNKVPADAEQNNEASRRQSQTPDAQVDRLQWLEDHGSSNELREIYLSYDVEALLRMADDGDIYALQAGHHKMLKEGYDDVAYEMLTDAAARGSTEALFMAGSTLMYVLEVLDSSLYEEDEVQSAYDLDVPEDSELTRELKLSAAAHFVVAGMRGHLGRSERELNDFQVDRMERRFTDEEWQAIGDRAEKLYRRIERKRESLGLEPFEGAYPASDIASRAQAEFER